MNCRRLFASIMLLYCYLAVGQTALWRVYPTYDSMEVIGDGLLKVSKDNLYGVISYDGKEKLPCSYSAITPFREGCSLLLAGEDELKGILYSDGQFLHMDGYAVDSSAPYYSEGLLAVKNNKDQWGYIDKFGEVKIRCEYVVARPFSYGLASVRDWDYYTHIDKSGRVSYLGDGYNDDNLRFASSFSKSPAGYPIAVIINMNDKLSFRRVDGSKVENSTFRFTKQGQNKEIYAGNRVYYFNPDGTVNRIVIGSVVKGYEEVKKYDNIGYRRVSSVTYDHGVDSKYNLKVNGAVILPSQFDSVIPLTQDLCAVELGNKYGILDLHREKNHFFSAVQSVYKVDHHAPVECAFRVESLPEGAVLEKPEIKLASGMVLYPRVEGNKLSFTVTPSLEDGACEEAYELSYELSGLKYPSRDLKMEFQYVPAFSVKWPTSKVLLDSQHNAAFEIVFENISSNISDECDIYIDNKFYETCVFQPNQKKSIQIRKIIDIQDEDQVTKQVNIRIKEKGCPEFNTSRGIVFERYFINN